MLNSINPRKMKSTKKGETILGIIVNVDGERQEMSLKVSCKKDEFDDLINSDTSNIIKNTFEQYKTKGYNYYNSEIALGHNPTADDVIDFLKNGKKQKKVYTLKSLWIDYNQNILVPKVKQGGHGNGGLTLGSFKKYKQAYNEVAKIISEDFPLEDFKYEQALKIFNAFNAKYGAETIRKYITLFKAMLQYAVNIEKYNRSDPFYKIKLPKVDHTPKTFTTEEYELIKGYQPLNDHMQKAKDYFIFACNCGLAFVDLNNLHKEDIKYDHVNKIYFIQKKRIKTDIQYIAPILTDGIEVLKKYDFNPQNFMISNQKLNEYMKPLAAQAGWQDPNSLTTHKCRHYYITSLIKKGVPIEYAKLAAGHSSINMTLLYTHLNVNDITNEISKKMNLGVYQDD